MSGTAMMQLAFAATLVLARVGSFAVACPAFLPPAAPSRLRTCGVVAVSAALTAALPQLPSLEAPYLALLLELLCGISMGMAVRLSALAVEYAGELIDVHAGFSFSQVLDPTSQAQTGPIQHLWHALAGLLFFVAEGPHRVIRALSLSFAALPPASLRWQPRVALFLLERAGEMFATGLQLALALLARVAPQLNIWGIGFGVLTAAVMAGLYLYTPAWVAYVAELWRLSIGRMGQVARLWVHAHG